MGAWHRDCCSGYRLSAQRSPHEAHCAQLRWQYAQRIRSDYRAHETASAMTAQTSVELAEQIIANVEGYLRAQHP